MAEKETPQALDVIGECLLYDEFMIHMFLADTLTEERLAAGPLLVDRSLQQLAKRQA